MRDMDRTVERVLSDTISISASQDEDAVQEWLARCRNRWMKNFPLQPVEVGKGLLVEIEHFGVEAPTLLFLRVKETIERLVTKVLL